MFFFNDTVEERQDQCEEQAERVNYDVKSTSRPKTFSDRTEQVLNEKLEEKEK